ncbi:hypothetical protein AXG93_1175s1230 [Marchantia polymorpha subsp. ruderalis]|uniref:Uncharacterized protein n=1 Tax=Marchantia polymorpha subsp. ruderalis TaxID=1480154 RepID=A0A176VNZ2_MARPO|nr:hypothetical protein AXG93_1175s1230 [Marchantia polymorpha subsp. ruderalis]
MEPSEERTEIASPSFLSSEQTRSVGSDNMLQPKSGEEVAKELTLSEAILEQIVAEVDGTVGNIIEDPDPPPPEEEVKSEIATKTSEELEEVCSSLRVTNENAQKMTMDLCGRLEKSKEVYEAAVKHAERLITTAGKWEQMHAEELARLKRVSPKNFGGRLHRRRRQKKGVAEQLGKAAMRSEESRRRMEKLEAAYRHLRDETTDELRLRVEKRLRRFAMPTLQITDCNRG